MFVKTELRKDRRPLRRDATEGYLAFRTKIGKLLKKERKKEKCLSGQILLAKIDQVLDGPLPIGRQGWLEAARVRVGRRKNAYLGKFF